VPHVPEDYVHRIGRTGRAGNSGRAITLVTPVDELNMRAIERLTGQSVERVTLPGFGGAQPVVAPAMAKPYAAIRHASSVGRRSFRPRRTR
jgi:superfamily II DNA/RNA helicase